MHQRFNSRPWLSILFITICALYVGHCELTRPFRIPEGPIARTHVKEIGLALERDPLSVAKFLTSNPHYIKDYFAVESLNQERIDWYKEQNKQSLFVGWTNTCFRVHLLRRNECLVFTDHDIAEVDKACEVECMIECADIQKEVGFPMFKYRGRWPIRRHFSMVEPVSCISSIFEALWSLYSLVILFNMSKKKAGFPFRAPTLLMWLFATIAFSFSTIFHYDDTPSSETLDYIGAFLLIVTMGYNGFVRCFQVHHPLSLYSTMAATYAMASYYVVDLFLNPIRYGFHQNLCAALLLLGLGCWIGASYVERHGFYKWVLLANACTLLFSGFEIKDFPPVLDYLLDAHATWHLCGFILFPLLTKFFVEEVKGWNPVAMQSTTMRIKADPKRQRLTMFMLLASAVLGFYIFIVKLLSVFEPFNDPTISRYTNRLMRPGWIPGRLIDLTDSQYRNFRGSIPSLLVAAAVFCLLARCFKPKPARGRDASTRGSSALAWYYTLFSIIFLTYLHGSRTLFLFSIAGVQYVLCHWLAGRPYVFPLLMWAFQCACLFCCNYFNGGEFRFLLGESFAWLDEGWLRGALRWQIHFNMCLLRHISYGMELHWSRLRASSRTGVEENEKEIEKVPVGNAALTMSYEQSVKAPIHPSSFGALWHFVYVHYVPLYLAGPILPYTSFIQQVRQRVQVQPSTQIWKEVLMWCFYFLSIEISCHYFYVNFVVKADKLGSMAPPEMFMTLFILLCFMLGKFTVLFRFFRIWSLCDGVEVLENLKETIIFRPSLIRFWRVWHVSFHKWILRYMYIPLGGRQYQYILLWPIFVFVALWHDPCTVTWLQWGLMNGLACSAEIGWTLLILPHIARRLRGSAIWPFLQGIGYSSIGTIMLFVNLSHAGNSTSMLKAYTEMPLGDYLIIYLYFSLIFILYEIWHLDLANAVRGK